MADSHESFGGRTVAYGIPFVSFGFWKNRVPHSKEVDSVEPTDSGIGDSFSDLCQHVE